ncbi:hypothetical protein GCM10022297_08430 [Lactobacillus hamsteri]|uniref:Transcriptional regulator n=1 Tax=Lactobacillus hamsteri DSM 5661 = JCM 6256 TaxID=1423754 RepID=A0A0R1YMD2_9LACO|nr:helix-turn-helix domain-containing protein [Lactobacillus hamsteri]KRM41131.1 hypothetical protein FC39_GL001333 [Lactobacillus hamsteri DSM 5661 = JCM 6256]
MADIGEKLRSAREEKGLSIEDIEKATKIQSRYLTAIEQNDFDKLPGDFYVRAFIRQYAQIVGLDGKELLSEYHQDVPESKPDEYVENSIDNKSEEVRETTDNKKNLWKNYLPRIAIGLGVIIVILVVYVLYARLSSNNQNNTADNNDNVTVSSQSSSSKKAAPVVKKNNVKVSRISDNEYRVTGLKNNRRLVIKAGQQTITTSVSVNGTPVGTQQSLAANQKRTVTVPSDAQRVVITLGNDNGTSIKIGDKRVSYAPIGNYRSITLLIGKAKHQSNNHDHNANSTNNDNANNSTTNSSSTTNNRQSNNTTQSSRSRQSETQSSRTTTQSSTQSQTQSSQTQSSQQQSTQQSSAANTTNNGNNGDSGNAQ